MSNQYNRLVLASGNGTNEERLLCLSELFKSLSAKEILSEK